MTAPFDGTPFDTERLIRSPGPCGASRLGRLSARRRSALVARNLGQMV